MTREMNKTYKHYKWILEAHYDHTGLYYERVKIECTLNPDIKEFFENCCRMEKLK